MLFSLTFFGCSTPYDQVHIPQPEPSIYKPGPLPPSGKKKPATQNPYKIKGIQYTPIASSKGFVQTGIASWYGKKISWKKNIQW